MNRVKAFSAGMRSKYTSIGVSISIPPELKKEADAQARRLRMSWSEYIRHAIRTLLKSEQKWEEPRA